MDAQLAGNETMLKREREGLFAVRPASYIFIILSVVLATYAYKFRGESIFSCQANGYTSDQYLAYCHATGYGDYEHGAFWFGLEPSIQKFATRADALVLGNSRIQLALSTGATADWFSSASARYYLLGFSAGGNSIFARELLRKLSPHAKVYVINVDPFFEQSATRTARTVMKDDAAERRYEMKHLWQLVHKSICMTLPAICGHKYVVFRSRETGAYRVAGLDGAKGSPVSYDEVANDNEIRNYAASGREFLSRLPVKPDCVILTLTPTVETRVGTANAIASALGMKLVAPELDGLRTFDGSHLDPPSAERWAKAFLQAAGPQILRCLDEAQGPRS